MEGDEGDEGDDELDMTGGIVFVAIESEVKIIKIELQKVYSNHKDRRQNLQHRNNKAHQRWRPLHVS